MLACICGNCHEQEQQSWQSKSHNQIRHSDKIRRRRQPVNQPTQVRDNVGLLLLNSGAAHGFDSCGCCIPKKSQKQDALFVAYISTLYIFFLI
jgi:hypothetical protein